MNYYLTTILKDKYNVIIEANSEKGIITAKNKIPDINCFRRITPWNGVLSLLQRN